MNYSVVVSQWTSMLQIVAGHLKRMGLRYGVIDGTVNPKRRMDLVEEFNTNPKGPQVSAAPEPQAPFCCKAFVLKH